MTADDPSVISKLLQTASDRRPVSASDALQELGIDPAENPTNLPQLKGQWKKYFYYAIIVLIIILLGFSGYIFYPDGNDAVDKDPEPLSNISTVTDTAPEITIIANQEQLTEKIEAAETMKGQISKNPVLPETGKLHFGHIF